MTGPGGRSRSCRLASALASLTLAACGVAGQRMAADGGCPEGEVCSQETLGARFKGRLLAEDLFGPSALHPTAAGGTQSFAVEFLEGQAVPFEPKTADPSVFSVGWSVDGHLVVEGHGDGEALLRLVEPNTEVLVERIALEVATVARAVVVPVDLAWTRAAGDEHFAVLAGRDMSLAVVAQAASGATLVDEGMTVTAPAGFEHGDVDGLAAPAQAVGELAFEVKAGGQTFAPKLAVVGAVDDLVLGCPSVQGWPETLVVEAGYELAACFRPLAGGAHVGGVACTFDAPPFVEVIGDDGCLITLRTKAQGQGTLRVSVEGVTREFPLEVVPFGSMLRPAAATAGRESARGTLGERARAFEAAP